MANVIIMFKDKSSNPKPVEASTTIEEGDSIDIQNSSNKSGN